MNIEIIKDLYLNKNLSTKDIAIKAGLSQSCIQRRLKKHDLLKKAGYNRKYNINHSFFDIINNEHKAYWLGFMYADGNVSSRDNRIILSSTDKDLLTQFNNCANSNYPILIEHHNVYNCKIYKISISSSQLKKDLIKSGCVPKKSLILKFPNKNIVSNNLINHFIRGYFDGDGSVSLYYNNNINVNRIMSSFSGTPDFIEKLSNILIKLKVVKGNSITKNKNINILQFSTHDSISLYNFLYKNATVFLRRKRDKFEKEFKNRGIFNDYNMGS